LNARSETAEQKPVFAESFRERRVILPSDGFYEWSRDGNKTKYLFTCFIKSDVMQRTGIKRRLFGIFIGFNAKGELRSKLRLCS